MPRYSKKNKISAETKDDADKIARATQRPGQTKEQTRLIAQGIQKGIDLYKKQQKGKARELDKKLRRVTSKPESQENSRENNQQQQSVKSNLLPWFLLVVSWIGFAAYIIINRQ